MLLLPACAEPALDLPVELPVVENAVRMPATAFIGPLDPSRVSDEELCADPPHYEKLLRSGAFGWRVVVLRGDEIWLPVPGTAHVRRESEVRGHFGQWAAVSNEFFDRCGRAAPGEFLFVADAATAMVLPDAWWESPHFLVSDPNPGSPLPEAVIGREPSKYEKPSIFAHPEGWISSNGPHDSSHHARARDAADAIEVFGVVAVYVSPDVAWREGFAGADALAGRGRRPLLGTFHYSNWSPAEAPRPRALVHLGLDDTLDVFAFEPAPWGSQMMMIGATGD